MFARVSHPPIEIGYPWRTTLRWTSEMFPNGTTLTAHVRAKREDEDIIATLTTANGGLVIVSTTELRIEMTVANTTAMSAGRVVLDIVRTDTNPDEHLGVWMQIPVRTPITRGL